MEAEAILKDNNLDFTLKEEFDAKVPTGTVIKQSPGAGSHVKAGRKIQLTVSKGAEPGVVPDLKGKNLAEATEMLHAAKLAVGKVTVQYKEGLLKGRTQSGYRSWEESGCWNQSGLGGQYLQGTERRTGP